MKTHPPMYFKNRLYYLLLACGGLVALDLRSACRRFGLRRRSRIACMVRIALV